MARGWERQSVEAQIEAPKDLANAPSQNRLTPAKAEMLRKRRKADCGGSIEETAPMSPS
jgi:hypothetical protein